MGLWLTKVVPNDWDMCSKSFFFFPSITFSNLDPIPLHCSCHCNFFILLLLFSCIFGFFIANALQLCASSFVSFKFSFPIFSQWCQMVRWKSCGNLMHLLYIFCYFRAITCPSFFLFLFFFFFFFFLALIHSFTCCLL